MNFVELINDLYSNLTSSHYLDSLWSKIREESTSIAATLEDYEIYRNHLPLDLKKYLKQCNTKLRDMKDVSDNEAWQILNERYISTFVYFILEEEDTSMDNALYAANIFILLNTMTIPEKQMFYKVTYLKILEILNDFNNSGEIGSNIIMFLMDDFKTMLSKINLPHETITSTVAVLHTFTYSCNEEFQQINTEISFESLGYIAFVSLKILAEKLIHQKKYLYPIILCLMSSLKSAPIGNLHANAKKNHQKNAILFIKSNCSIFHSRNSCLITDALKTVCLSSEYDDNQGIAELIQQLPSEINQDFFHFFVEMMVCSRDDFKRNCLDLVVPLLRHSPEYETISKRITKAEIILTNVVMLFADKSEDIKTRALKIVAEYSEDTLGRRVLRKMMGPDNFADINKDSVQDILYRAIDPNWGKKKLNTSYIQFICNLFIIRKDLLTIKALNRLRNICLKGSPFDLKPCIINLKRLLEYHSSEHDVTMYVLSIFTKQMFHSMSTSAIFAKELGDLIFSNITVNEGENFIWNIINHLISHNFMVYSIFEKFHSLQLLQERNIRLLMEYKIQESACRTPALKLLCIMLNFVQYTKSHLLEEILEDWIIGNRINLSPTDLSLVIYALTKVMEKKNRSDCNHLELQNYRQMQHLVCRTFFEQAFPAVSVNYVIVLLSTYAGLIEEDVYWDSSACVSFEEELRTKLNEVCNTVLENHIYLLRDVVYVGELMVMKKTLLNPATFNLLKRIATASEHTTNFSDYLKNHEEVWSLCLMLYIKACFINRDLVENCVENLLFILSNKSLTEYSKLQILYALYDICSMHFEYYDPLVPFLFHVLNDENDYIKFISAKIIMKLVQEEHLRLIEGQYYVFMSLLADKNDILSQNVELFVRECFVKKFPQTIAGSFIPSVVHYNFCYTYPGISLLEADRELLKLMKNSMTNRRNIYYCLFQYLPSNIQFNVLHQMSGEILSKFSNKKFNHVPEVLDIIEDILSIILLIVPKEKIPHVIVNTHYFDEEVKHIQGLFTYVENTGKNNENKVEKTSLRSLCFNLLRILYSDFKDSRVCHNVLFTILLLRKSFEPVIKQLVHEDNNLKDLFSSLKKYYQKIKHQFQEIVVTITPQFSSSLTDDSAEFYWRELTDFTFINPCKIIDITHC
ncbi:hypothetical protein RN001_002765 [Aquatica leii]|uniref:Condensin complex subunit 1 C-terminal domain-containing protein n=1 Tax=Aquatica leii TaxID=1421715 RepID=A0AAN7PHB8_9COLE|nr:hypothetical protein RN001_002765 [Aquatica leii]